MTDLNNNSEITNNIEEDLEVGNSKKKINIKEDDVFGAGVTLGCSVVIFKVAKAVFPKVVEKTKELVTKILEK